jgi:type IV secretory pathway VirB10-like protein
MSDKKQEFVVSDRRRFAPEGELRADVTTTEEEAPTAAPPTPPAPQAESTTPQAATAPPSPPQQAQEAQPEAGEEEMAAPPTAQEQQEQDDAYKASSKKLDEMFKEATAGKGRTPTEMTFERLVESFYMTALIQLGAIRQEGEPPAVDIMGARQTIDSLTILQEKTKGNLSDREQTLLQNVLFELRMAWIEITNAIASGAAGKPGPGGPGPIGGARK